MSKSSFACIGKNRGRLTLAVVVTSILLGLNLRHSWASDTNQLVSSLARADETNSQEVLRAYIQLQEQLHSTQLAIEQNRKEAKEAAAQNAQFLAGRLHDIEAALAELDEGGRLARKLLGFRPTQEEPEGAEGGMGGRPPAPTGFPMRTPRTTG